MRNKFFHILTATVIVASFPFVQSSGGQVYAQDSLPIQAKGMWIWMLWAANNGNLNPVIDKLKSTGVTWVVVKMGDGDSYYNKSGKALYNWAQTYGGMDSVVGIFHKNGIKIFAFQYVYGVPNHWGVAGTSESGVANMILGVKDIDGLLVDAEIQYDTLTNRVAAAQAYLDTIRAYHPNSFLGLTSWARIIGHNTFPWTTFLSGVQVNMPQTYWAARPTTPQNELGLMNGQFASFTQTWVSQGDSAADKPIMPIGQGEYFGYGNNIQRGDISSFCNLSQQMYHYAGVSLWEYAQIDSPFVWDEYSSAWPLTPVSQAPATPNDFDLSQNYPNPFNPTTTIKFRVASFGFVSLKVYDVLGREVATLVNERMNGGSYVVTFDASKLPSGVYFYRLIAGNNTAIMKMVLIK
ncbi:MAG: T9SS type A sorting domain-containing protein [Bacteroidetes bacterium]|nr:T9SS type A sorting domain-containing protein [Bacteroidota bacterium]MCL5737615.1 T9SS type A sorting domain-containing protein [Bacteroidota bacterium]